MLLSLEYLNINNNVLNDINLSNNLFLKELYAASNHLISITLKGLKHLEYLYIPDNKLSILNLGSNTSLKKVWAYNNDLSSLNVRNMNNSKIEIFDVERNFKLTCIQVDNHNDAMDGKGSYPNWKLSEFCYYSNVCEEFTFSMK
jgi:Leucine-rich repeat (LRR) protein